MMNRSLAEYGSIAAVAGKVSRRWQIDGGKFAFAETRDDGDLGIIYCSLPSESLVA